MSENLVKIGEVTHFFSNINVAVIELSGAITIGDEILIIGATSDFSQRVESIQIEHEQVKEAKSGDDIGLKVIERVRKGDEVFKKV
jgi:putative protease